MFNIIFPSTGVRKNSVQTAGIKGKPSIFSGRRTVRCEFVNVVPIGAVLPAAVAWWLENNWFGDDCTCPVYAFIGSQAAWTLRNIPFGGFAPSNPRSYDEVLFPLALPSALNHFSLMLM